MELKLQFIGCTIRHFVNSRLLSSIVVVIVEAAPEVGDVVGAVMVVAVVIALILVVQSNVTLDRVEI